ncbi:DNA phosphorothioation system sulfurtransferase DndC [bacterium]|nr:DNA phosphorothioation system sulfurtransferase DndC [bacterium]
MPDLLVPENPQTTDAELILESVSEITCRVIREIQDQYLEDTHPWVVGFSGGKDSTAVLQLIFYALSDLPKSKLNKAVHVLSNDTLVENPSVVKFLDEQLQRIETAGKKRLFAHCPDLFHVFKSIPKLEDTFWLNLIGKGYPSPNRWFRWCTERMKINPANEYILKTVNEHGKAIIILGTRKAESSNRSAAMTQYEIPGLRLHQHKLPNAYVFAPIAELSNQEVWTYLINTPNPWGSDNQQLLDLYRSAADIMECPLVIDDTTPSCGNSRFGCWVCTVVDRDKSMTNMILNGHEWMQPMIDFRDWLHEIRNDESKRDNRRRNGSPGIGPFSKETRKEILERLFKVECEVEHEFITKQELIAIQNQWNYDGNFRYSVAEIYSKIKGNNSMVPEEQMSERRNEEFEILEEVCKDYEINPNHIKELMQLEREHLSFLRRHNIFEDMRNKIERFVAENQSPTDKS